MGKIILKNIDHEKVEIEVIRYFENNENEYLIYSLNELVGDGYIKLYASKIIGNGAHIIVDDDEWFLIKEIIKNIIKANHEGMSLNVIDLDEDELDNITLNDTRIFKLQGNLVNLLSENKQVKSIELEIPIIDEIEENSEEDVEDNRNLEEINRELLEENELLKEEILNYKQKIEQIIEIIENS